MISAGQPGPLCVAFDLCALYLVMFGQSRESEFGEVWVLSVGDLISFLAVVCLSSPASDKNWHLYISGISEQALVRLYDVDLWRQDPTRSWNDVGASLGLWHQICCSYLQLMSFCQGSFDSSVIVVRPGVIIECANGELTQWIDIPNIPMNYSDSDQ